MMIAKQLEQFTASIASFDTTRNYISMSHAALDEQEIRNQIDKGFEDTLPIRLRCYKGYQMEADLLNRLKKLFPDKVKTGIEYVAFDGIVKGHPDFEFEGYPADCKTVPLEEYLRDRVSKKIYWQMQAYMYWSSKEKALVIMEARDSGAIRDYWITANQSIQYDIGTKYARLVEYWNSLKALTE